MAAAINDAENRIVGMMVGSAVADAIGIYTDQLTKENATNAYGQHGRIVASYKASELTIHLPDRHRAQYRDGNWSEITEMALCTLFAMVHEKRGTSLPRRLRYLSQNGNRAYGLNPLPLGQPITDIVEAEDYLNNAEMAARRQWTSSGNREQDYHTGSNVPLIRIHPYAAYSRCNISVMIAAALLRGLIRREIRTENQINPLIQKCKRHIELLESRVQAQNNQEGAYYRISDESWAELSRLLTIQSLPDLDLQNSRGEAWKCLSAGIFSLRTAMTRLERLSGQAREDNRMVLFAEIINNVALEGGAAQANAAFAGALLGAYLGYDAIHEQAIRGLSHREFLMRKSKLFCEVLLIIPGDPNRVEQDSEMGPDRDRSQRTVMQRTIERDQNARHGMLERRWEQRHEIMAARRRTVSDSLNLTRRLDLQTAGARDRAATLEFVRRRDLQTAGARGRSVKRPK